MENFKDKLFNYEVQAPKTVWNKISKELDEKTAVKLPLSPGRRKFLFYGMTAAASLLIIFASNVFIKKTNQIKPVSHIPALNVDNLVGQKIKDSIALNYKYLESIINASDDQKLASNFNGKNIKYITIAGPEGQAVKISPKVATLILSADNEYPPRAVWDKKIEKWKQIMLSNATPTATSLVDMLQSAAANGNIE